MKYYPNSNIFIPFLYSFVSTKISYPCDFLNEFFDTQIIDLNIDDKNFSLFKGVLSDDLRSYNFRHYSSFYRKYVFESLKTYITDNEFDFDKYFQEYAFNFLNEEESFEIYSLILEKKNSRLSNYFKKINFAYDDRSLDFPSFIGLQNIVAVRSKIDDNKSFFKEKIFSYVDRFEGKCLDNASKYNGKEISGFKGEDIRNFTRDILYISHFGKSLFSEKEIRGMVEKALNCWVAFLSSRFYFKKKNQDSNFYTDYLNFNYLSEFDEILFLSNKINNPDFLEFKDYMYSNFSESSHLKPLDSPYFLKEKLEENFDLGVEVSIYSNRKIIEPLFILYETGKINKEKIQQRLEKIFHKIIKIEIDATIKSDFKHPKFLKVNQSDFRSLHYFFQDLCFIYTKYYSLGKMETCNQIKDFIVDLDFNIRSVSWIDQDIDVILWFEHMDILGSAIDNLHYSEI